MTTIGIHGCEDRPISLQDRADVLVTYASHLVVRVLHARMRCYNLSSAVSSSRKVTVMKGSEVDRNVAFRLSAMDPTPSLRLALSVRQRPLLHGNEDICVP